MKISHKWSKFAKNWLGDEEGKHCHWCNHIKHEDGCSYCTHPKSKFNDDDRIRGWDGKSCANQCGHFELKEWYCNDKNFNEYFREEEKDGKIDNK